MVQETVEDRCRRGNIAQQQFRLLTTLVGVSGQGKLAISIRALDDKAEVVPDKEIKARKIAQLHELFVQNTC